MRILSFSSRTRAMSAANTDFAPPAGAVMMVTVPALTASGLGNAHRVLSGLNTGSDVPDGAWAAGPVWASALCSDPPATATANTIHTNDLMIHPELLSEETASSRSETDIQHSTHTDRYVRVQRGAPI